MRIIEFRYLNNILSNLRSGKNHLGVSANYIEGRGICIVIVSPSSPFKNYLMMGDVIIKANGQKVRKPEALQRICIFNAGRL
jgi:S1-C subfamily serine protease